MMKDLTSADMLHIHAVHQPAAGVHVVDAAFLGVYSILRLQLPGITFRHFVWYQVIPTASIAYFLRIIPVMG